MRTLFTRKNIFLPYESSKTKAMAQTFKRSDIVRLKSGGPNMTVKGYSSISKSGILGAFLQPHVEQKPEPEESVMVDVTWFEKEKIRTGEFHQDLLELVK